MPCTLCRARTQNESGLCNACMVAYAHALPIPDDAWDDPDHDTPEYETNRRGHPAPARRITP